MRRAGVFKCLLSCWFAEWSLGKYLAVFLPKPYTQRRLLMIEGITVIRKALGCLFEVKFLLLPGIGFSSAKNYFFTAL